MVKPYTLGWYRGYFQFGVAVGVKQAGREADHSATLEQTLRTMWSYTSISQRYLIAGTGANLRLNLL